MTCGTQLSARPGTHGPLRALVFFFLFKSSDFPHDELCLNAIIFCAVSCLPRVRYPDKHGSCDSLQLVTIFGNLLSARVVSGSTSSCTVCPTKFGMTSVEEKLPRAIVAKVYS